MKKFKYNWATAEMAKMYLRNSRAQGVRKARAAAEASGETQEGSAATGPGLTTANGSAEAGSGGVDSSDSSSDENA